MPVSAIRKVSQGQNGVGAFILPCRRLTFHYSDWAGSSRGMNKFLQTRLAPFAAAHPSIEVRISPRAHAHPVVKAGYVNGREKAICVRNMEPTEILRKVELLRDASGVKLRKTNKKVESRNESVRGVWSALHEVQMTGKTWKI